MCKEPFFGHFWVQNEHVSTLLKISPLCFYEILPNACHPRVQEFGFCQQLFLFLSKLEYFG